jgi:hypothetical protein
MVWGMLSLVVLCGITLLMTWLAVRENIAEHNMPEANTLIAEAQKK